MVDLAVLVPTRERVERFVAMADACRNLAAGSVEIVAYVDEDDPQVDGYRAATRGRAQLLVGPRLCLSQATNFAATWALNPSNGPTPRYLASMGDDHLVRTAGWDYTLARACGEVGWAYGDDLLQGQRLPTAWVQTANLARVLGWVMLPDCQHMYVDNAVLDLGKATSSIRYVPEVVVEHLHPVAGKAAVDASYAASNSRDQYARDRAAYQGWLSEGLDAAVARVRELQHKTVTVGR